MAITAAGGFPVATSANGQATQAVTPVALGDILICSGRVAATSPSVTNVTGGGVAQWRKVLDFSDGSDSRYLWLWWGIVTATGASTVTLTFSSAIGTTGVEIVVDSFTSDLAEGTSWAVVVPGSMQNPDSANPLRFPTLSSVDSASLYWGYARSSNALSAGSSAGFTYSLTPANDIVASNPGLVANTSYAPSAPQVVGSNWDAIAAIFTSVPAFSPGSLVARQLPRSLGPQALGPTFFAGLATPAPAPILPIEIVASADAIAAATVLLSAAADITASAGSMSAASIALSAPPQLALSAASVSQAAASARPGAQLTPSASSASALSIPLSAQSRLAPSAAVSSQASTTANPGAVLAPSAGSRSSALAALAVTFAPTPYTFDAIVILNSAFSEVAEIARPLGPLETGHIDDLGEWIVATDPVALILNGFGIDAAGVPYYDTHAVDPGDEADLFLDPVDGLLWLSR